MRSWAHVGIVAFGLFVATLARADEKARGLATLEWNRASGAEACISEPELVDDVERSLKRRVFTRGRADRVLRAAIAPSASGWHATIELSTVRGVALGARELDIEGNDCREASDALVLAISLMADLPEVPAEREPPSRPAPSPAPRPVHLRASIGPAVVVDDRSAVQPGGQLGLELVPRGFVPIRLGLLLQAQTRNTQGERRYVHLGVTIATTLCPLGAARARFELLGCIGPEMTVHVARGQGFSENVTALSSTFGGLVEARASYEFTHRLRGVLFLCGVATPQRVDLFATQDGAGRQAADRTPYVSGIAGIGVTLEL